MEKELNGTFADFVGGELIGLILDVLDGREVEVPGDSSILFIKELHCLSCNVNHACRRVNTPVSELATNNTNHTNINNNNNV